MNGGKLAGIKKKQQQKKLIHIYNNSQHKIHFSAANGVRLRVNNSFNYVVFSDFVYNLMKRKISNHFLRDFLNERYYILC